MDLYNVNVVLWHTRDMPLRGPWVVSYCQFFSVLWDVNLAYHCYEYVCDKFCIFPCTTLINYLFVRHLVSTLWNRVVTNNPYFYCTRGMSGSFVRHLVPTLWNQIVTNIHVSIVHEACLVHLLNTLFPPSGNRSSQIIHVSIVHEACLAQGIQMLKCSTT